MQNFPVSLAKLRLYGRNSEVVSFAMAEEDMSSSSFLLPSTLTYLGISGLVEMESLSKGLQHLTYLQHLGIFSCPKLRDLPDTLLPSLSSLIVSHVSTELKKKCRSRKGKY
ncbi:hypothetical protein L1987_54723 [Smallanthus sonchifolius]|uniref:Uncharacterized protein n=1 Tax=Smallanthus sonchifolius TaxID=185202 RepID=A0ACB9E903_9ASTR|nr:hypothetical protein L1987_54723 [Smallanthus sonchifolius]